MEGPWSPPTEAGGAGGAVPGAPEGGGGGPGWPRARQVLMEALLRIKKKDKKQFFAVPVDPKLVPDYHLVIRRPMNFEAMREKAERDLYPGGKKQ